MFSLYRLYVETKKIKDKMKTEQTHRHRNKLMVTKGEKEGNELGVWD